MVTSNLENILQNKKKYNFTYDKLLSLQNQNLITMATISARVTANVYGTMQGAPPFGTGLGAPDRATFWPNAVSMNFPTTGTVFHPVSPGIQVNNSSNYIYSIIEVQPTGLNVHSTKYCSNQSVATLATASQIS